MFFRISLTVAYLVFAINASAIFQLEAANVLEKGLFLIASTAYVLGRTCNPLVLVLLGVNLLMIFTFGALTPYPGFSWLTLINGLNQVIIVYFLLAGTPTKEDRDSFLWIAMWLPLISSLLGLLYQAAGLRSVFFAEFASGVQRFSGSLIPAFLSGIAMCGIFAAMHYAQLKKPIYYVMCAVNLGILLAAGGRATLATAILVCGTSFYFNRKTSAGLKVTGTILALVVGGLILAFTWDNIAARFESSGLNGREAMWAYLQTLADQYPWTGIGFSHQFFAVPRQVVIFTGSTAAHNDYYRLLVELGYIGMPLFYLLLTTAVFSVWNSRVGNRNITILVAYLGYLFLSRTDNVLAGPSYFPLIIIAVMVSSQHQRAVKGIRPAPSQGPARGPKPAFPRAGV